MGINNVVDFEFMEKPTKTTLLEALKILYYINAIDKDGVITNLGTEISKFPIDCCYARALISSKYYSVEKEMAILVSLISCESVWYNVNKYDETRRNEFEKKKLEFIDKNSDHMTLLNIYKEWEYNKFDEDWCKRNFLHYRALKQSRNINDQITDYLNQLNFEELKNYFNIGQINDRLFMVENNKNLDTYDKINLLIRMSLGQGFYMNSARRMPNTNDGTYLRINDGSCVSVDSFSAITIKCQKPDLLLYTELGGTNTKAIMKQVSIIELNWISDLLINITNVDEGKLSGIEKTKNIKKEPNEINFYSILNSEKMDEEEKEKIEEKQKLKQEQALERMLQRKKERTSKI
jgi:ATP-dependent RNA helicase DHX8/PRP22